ncbi:MAG: Gfo/Idh/MocA family oxidoreductase, partial [Acidimicrobiia bacterium]
MIVGIIGTGRIGAIHANNLSRHPAVSTIIVTDAIRAQAEHVAATYGADVASGPTELLESVDAVVISTPADVHVEQIELAVDHRVPALCEKPLAM